VKLLLDTNVFLRWMANIPLPGRLERLLNKSSNEKLISIVTAWEIVNKPKLNLSVSDIEAGIDASGASVLPLNFRHIDRFHALPFYKDHRDPFDRMLIAQALAEDLAIASSDQRFFEYKGLQVIWD
jgi:PIN domain nuclease of toxin-antitoxin system